MLKTRGKKMDGPPRYYWKAVIDRVVITRIDRRLSVALDGRTIYSEFVGESHQPFMVTDPEIDECLEILRAELVLDELADV
jgi:hypothetical protein